MTISTEDDGEDPGYENYRVLALCKKWISDYFDQFEVDTGI